MVVFTGIQHQTWNSQVKVFWPLVILTATRLPTLVCVTSCVYVSVQLHTYAFAQIVSCCPDFISVSVYSMLVLGGHGSHFVVSTFRLSMSSLSARQCCLGYGREFLVSVDRFLSYKTQSQVIVLGKQSCPSFGMHCGELIWGLIMSKQ